MLLAPSFSYSDHPSAYKGEARHPFVVDVLPAIRNIRPLTLQGNATSRTMANDKRVSRKHLVSRYEPTYSSCECDSPCSSLDLAKSPVILWAKRRLYSKNMAVRQATIMPKARMKNNPAVCCTEMILPT